MKEKELKKLSRTDLLALLLEKTKENERLLAEIENLEGRLDSRAITIDKAGSIAEASLQLSGIFDAAQDAAAQYLENIRELSGKQEAVCARLKTETEEKCRQLEAETAKKCKAFEAATKEKCTRLKEDTLTRCREMMEKARAESTACWAEVPDKLEGFYQSHEGLREMLNPKGGST